MYVVKRDGRKELIMFDKITARVRKLCYGLNGLVDPLKVAMRVIEGLYDGVTTSELDNLAAEIAATMTTTHPDYAKLAARISVSNLHKNTKKSFSETMKDLYEYINPRTGKKAPLLSDEVYKVVSENSERLDSTIIYNRDFGYDYFGFKTLERSYLLKVNGQIAERPQHMLMRVSVGIHVDDLDAAIETYELMSKKYFTHATPTLFNSGTPKPQMSSCFLLAMKDDSIEGIYDTLKQTAKISQSAGGIGLSIHNVRARGSYIGGTNGTSNGIVPMLKVFNDTARYVDQGGGKRKGSFAIYMEPWHADIYDFLDLKKNHGKEEMRARDLFYAMWISDLFMKRVEGNQDWTLMCPNECPGLFTKHSEEFETLYLKYEAEGKGRKTVKARELWEKILESQIETGTPYMLYKDAANRKSNQKNLGTIRSSNLCTEIMEYTSPDEVAVCNLASIALPMFIKNGAFDHKELFKVTKRVTKNLNKVIDRNYYPVKEAENSNMRHRPIGLGVQGLADAFIMLRLPFTSDEAKEFGGEGLGWCLHELKQVAIDTNKVWAEKLGIPQSTAITCVKPSGTVSQLVDSASGIHTRYSEYYIRTVRGDNKDPLTQFMIDQGIPYEACVMKPDTTTVFSFPMKSPEGAITTKDMTAIEQLEMWLTYQRHWCEHKPSVTISVRPDEWIDVGAFVYKHFDEMSGVSFLPYSEHTYQQAPYQEVSKKSYDEMVSKSPTSIDWSKLSDYETEDTSKGSSTFACVGGTCEIVDLT